MCGLFRDDCKLLIKFQGTSLGIATIKGPVQLPIEIEGIQIKPEVLQTAGQIAQVLDMRQYESCKVWKAIGKLKVDDNKKLQALIDMENDERRLSELAILASANYSSAQDFEKALSLWIASAYPRAIGAEKEVAGKLSSPTDLSAVMQKATAASPLLKTTMSMSKAASFDIASVLNLD